MQRIITKLCQLISENIHQNHLEIFKELYKYYKETINIPLLYKSIGLASGFCFEDKMMSIDQEKLLKIKNKVALPFFHLFILIIMKAIAVPMLGP